VVRGGHRDLAVTREGVITSLPWRNEVLQFDRHQVQTPQFAIPGIRKLICRSFWVLF